MLDQNLSALVYSFAALALTMIESRLAQALARARWRRCFALSSPLRLLARIVLLSLAVFTFGSDLGWDRHF